MRIGDTLKKAASLLVEFEDDPDASTAPPSPADQPVQAKTVEQIVREADGPNLDEIKVPQDAKPPIPTPDGQLDFANIYRHAGLPPTPMSCEQVLEVMATLPTELPLETRRQTVRVTLNAMGRSLGATPETVVADASRKLAALASFADGYNRQAIDYVTKAEVEISALENQIEQKRQSIEKAKQQTSLVVDACQRESERLDDILEFFSLDVAPSKHAK
jgi:hypothetical protein